jgi:DNA topoisomerase-1
LCQTGEVIARKSRWGKEFFGCARYPECDWASWKKPEVGMVVTAEEWKAQQAIRKEKAAKRAKVMEMEKEKMAKVAPKKTAKKAGGRAKKTSKKS